MGKHAPGVHDQGYRAAHNLIRSHGRVYQLYQKMYKKTQKGNTKSISNDRILDLSGLKAFANNKLHMAICCCFYILPNFQRYQLETIYADRTLYRDVQYKRTITLLVF